jgi:hypothetical protein
MNVCNVEGCVSPVFVKSRQLCSRHYNRLRNTGTTDDGPKARGTVEHRFWRKVDRRGPNECWPWLGNTLVQGYGSIGSGGRNGKHLRAHRVAWELANGPIPKSTGHHGTVVRHKCDNRLCCNPSHLEIGTQGDNVADMINRRGGNAAPYYGEDHVNAKLNDEIVRQIRLSDRSNQWWAKKVGVSKTAIGFARRGITWKHVK